MKAVNRGKALLALGLITLCTSSVTTTVEGNTSSIYKAEAPCQGGIKVFDVYLTGSNKVNNNMYSSEGTTVLDDEPQWFFIPLEGDNKTESTLNLPGDVEVGKYSSERITPTYTMSTEQMNRVEESEWNTISLYGEGSSNTYIDTLVPNMDQHSTTTETLGPTIKVCRDQTTPKMEWYYKPSLQER